MVSAADATAALRKCKADAERREQEHIKTIWLLLNAAGGEIRVAMEDADIGPPPDFKVFRTTYLDGFMLWSSKRAKA